MIITVFRSRLKEGAENEYGVVAREMRELVQTMDGFVDQSFYESADGERVTVVRFRDQDAQTFWASHPAHRAAQERGRREFYSWYDIFVGEELYARQFDAS